MPPANQPTGPAADLPVEAAMPPAPPGESPPEAVERVRAVAEALTQLGEEADPARVAAHVKARGGPDLTADEVARIQEKLIERSHTPPGPDQPSPQEARR